MSSLSNGRTFYPLHPHRADHVASWLRLLADVTSTQRARRPPSCLQASPHVLFQVLPGSDLVAAQPLLRGSRSVGPRPPGRQYARGGCVPTTRQGEAKQRNIPEEWRLPKRERGVRLTPQPQEENPSLPCAAQPGIGQTTEPRPRLGTSSRGDTAKAGSVDKHQPL